MDNCHFCGGRLDPCNESEIVCPWGGEADCWRSQASATEFDEDFDEVFDEALVDDFDWEDSS